MKARRLSLRFLLIACLAVDAAVLVAWVLFNRLYFAQPCWGRDLSLLAGGFVSEIRPKPDGLAARLPEQSAP